MGKKIFISYKYADSSVQKIRQMHGLTTVRDYVDVIQDMITDEDHINKGEDDGEDMSSLADSTIGSKLGDKIFDSTVTIILISKNMRENKSEKEQWIPWEISYSLKEQSRQGQRSKTNALLAVVLPDEYASYTYFLTRDEECNCTNYNKDNLFSILKYNMFNIKNPSTHACNGRTIYHGYFSYIHTVKWEEFKNDFDGNVNIALEIHANRDNYEIRKNLN